jgi:phage FluMu protein Com
MSNRTIFCPKCGALLYDGPKEPGFKKIRCMRCDTVQDVHTESVKP